MTEEVGKFLDTENKTEPIKSRTERKNVQEIYMEIWWKFRNVK